MSACSASSAHCTHRALPHPPAPDAAVVLDTNVVLDWFVFADPGVQRLAQAVCGGALRWLGCHAMQAELAHVLAHGSLGHRGVSAESVLTSTLHWQTCIDLPAKLPQDRLRCRDASDQMFLDLALHSGARWLFSRDRALLSLARKAAAHGLAIVEPRHWTLSTSAAA